MVTFFVSAISVGELYSAAQRKHPSREDYWTKSASMISAKIQKSSILKERLSSESGLSLS